MHTINYPASRQFAVRDYAATSTSHKSFPLQGVSCGLVLNNDQDVNQIKSSRNHLYI